MPWFLTEMPASSFDGKLLVARRNQGAVEGEILEEIEPIVQNI